MSMENGLGDHAFTSSLLDALLSQTAFGVAICDESGRLTFANAALETMVGESIAALTPDQRVSQFAVHDAQAATQLTGSQVPLARALSGHVVADVLISTRKPGRPVKFLRCNATQLRSDRGVVVGAVAIVVDVTEDLAVTRGLEQLRERIVSTVNHELRTPLTSLIGNAELLHDLLDDLPEEAHRPLEAILRAGQALRRTAQTITDLVELEACAVLDKDIIDVTLIARELLEAFQARAIQHGIKLVLHAPAEVLAAADATKIRKALAALMDNAITYAPVGSTVETLVQASDSRIRLRVIDTGVGIAPSERDRLRQPFQRGDDPNTPSPGRGLGLAIAHTIATAHSGRLVLTQNEPIGLDAWLEIPRGIAPPATC